MKTKQAIRILLNLFKKKKVYQKLGNLLTLLPIWEGKVSLFHAP